MSYGVRFRVWGDFALFTRPEMKAERVSYDIPPASALRGIAEAIHWKPAIRYDIRRVAILNPVRFVSIRRNELGTVGPCEIEENRQQRASLVLRDVDYIVHAEIHLTGESDREAERGGNVVAKHRDIFHRRLENGQQHFQPYLGCREFPAHCGPTDGKWKTCACNGECARINGPASAHPNPAQPPTMCARNLALRPLGAMLREVRYEKTFHQRGKNKGEFAGYKATPEFFEFPAVMESGVVDFHRKAE